MKKRKIQLQKTEK